MKRYYREGMKSFIDNKGKYINPYEVGSEEFNQFERGWSQQLKRSSDEEMRELKLNRVSKRS